MQVLAGVLFLAVCAVVPHQLPGLFMAVWVVAGVLPGAGVGGRLHRHVHCPHFNPGVFSLNQRGAQKGYIDINENMVEIRESKCISTK